MNRVARFVDSLGGRIAILLAIGTMLAVTVALLFAERARHADFLRFQGERVLASAADIATRLEHDPDRTLSALARDGIIGANLISPPITPPAPNAGLSAVLRQRLGDTVPARIAHADAAVCGANDPFWKRTRTAGFGRPTLPDCWLLTVPAGGRLITVGLDLPRFPSPPSMIRDPVFMLMISGACIALSLLAARLASRPLYRLTSASRAFARSIDAEPVSESGPADVREALATFNLMQERVREGLRERTRLLAAISHDLQTPLTRLRLRLEQVSDQPLRERLVGDLSATLRMMRRGLDLARSGESAEDWTVVDLDSLLSSMADDAAEFGHDVTLLTGCAARVRVKPDALTRCLGNLVDNAVKYGGSAGLSCHRDLDGVRVLVRDHGPGMPADLLPRAFEPFLRGDTAADAGEGSGIGLAIARAQATAIGGTLTLRNHPEGGLEAALNLPIIAKLRV